MAKARLGVDETNMDTAVEMKESKPKKESTPKAGYFLFVKDKVGEFNTFVEVDSYPNLKSYREGVKEKAKAIPDGEETPRWVRFRGEFKEVEIVRIRDVKVRL